MVSLAVQPRASDSTRRQDLQSPTRTRRASGASAKRTFASGSGDHIHRAHVISDDIVCEYSGLIGSIYDEATAYIDKFNVASTDVPIKFNRFKKATEQPTPEEHLDLKKLPVRSLLGAVGHLMPSTIPSIAYAWKEIWRFAADYRQRFIALLELIAYIKKHPTPLCIGADGGDELTAF